MVLRCDLVAVVFGVCGFRCVCVVVVFFACYCCCLLCFCCFLQFSVVVCCFFVVVGCVCCCLLYFYGLSHYFCPTCMLLVSVLVHDSCVLPLVPCFIYHFPCLFPMLSSHNSLARTYCKNSYYCECPGYVICFIFPSQIVVRYGSWMQMTESDFRRHVWSLIS